ncbi:scarecrow-like protein 14 [Salvia hispanica]|uniref:scarecrow-like protein 14 n=1 Tax=Salvia hispanica TaxID=49212 RepID=UPI002009840F|nr:scarecrow-like protein 14 [Salvia hispanica]
MDNNFRAINGTVSRMKSNNEALHVFPNANVISDLRISDRFFNGNIADNSIHTSSQFSFDTGGQSREDDSPEDFDFSDGVLKFINHILMEEDVEDNTCIFQESAALQAAEKSFHEVLAEQRPASSDNHLVLNLDQGIESPDEKFLEESRSNVYDPSDVEVFSPDWFYDPDFNGYNGHHITVDVRSTCQSSYSSSSSNGTFADGPVDSPVSILKNADVFSNQESAMQFMKAAEEASRFLPCCSNLITGVRNDESRERAKEVGSTSVAVKLERRSYEETLDIPRGKKNPYHETSGLQEERSSKQSAIYSATTLSDDMFDLVLLCSGGKNESALRKELSEVTKSTPQEDQPDGVNGGKIQGKKKGGRRNVVDLRTLLSLCAQAVAADDRRTANEFLKQIRQHATLTGDGMQRLACYFADGLEARMAGYGDPICAPANALPTSASDILRAYHILIATCPFRKISNFFANKTIMNVSEKATRIHIVDFGIFYGFQWPSFMQRLSNRPGGPPKLRITGIDFPCPGFRPAARVEEAGRRLAGYAETFGVPFEFNAIAQKWDTIRIEDLKIEKDELLVVSCLFRFRNLLDETVIVNSPRNIVLSLIRKMNPAVFVQGVVNGSYNAPFFITRFREAMFHYSSLFDMLDTIIPREIHERMLLERTIFGQEAMNVISCEGAERIERPETYKQWQVRNMRAGFVQLPLDKEIVKLAKNRVKSSYHKDFVIDQDGQWMLQGWKGRIIYALSSWRPAY